MAGVAKTVQDDENMRSESHATPDGYIFSFEVVTSDEFSAQRAGERKDLGNEGSENTDKGSMTWVDREGQTHPVDYIPNLNELQPESAHQFYH